jgi:hypothetical protein
MKLTKLPFAGLATAALVLVAWDWPVSGWQRVPPRPSPPRWCAKIRTRRRVPKTSAPISGVRAHR